MGHKILQSQTNKGKVREMLCQFHTAFIINSNKQLQRNYVGDTYLERLPIFRLRHTLKQRNNACIVVLHFTVPVGSPIMSISHIPK